MKEFLFNNYKVIIYIGFALVDLFVCFVFTFLSILISLLKKQKLPILSKVLEVLPSYINKVEKVEGLTGEEKKTIVLDSATSLYKKLVGSVDDYVIKQIDNSIEEILSTPQKKK